MVLSDAWTAATKQNSETESTNDRLNKNLSRANMTSRINTLDETDDDDDASKKEENTHIKKQQKSPDISENVKINGEVTHEKSRRDNPKKNNSTVKESDQRERTEQHSKGITSKDASKQKGEDKNITRNNGRQRAMSSTDMVVWLADTLDRILRNGESRQHSLSTTGSGKL